MTSTTTRRSSLVDAPPLAIAAVLKRYPHLRGHRCALMDRIEAIAAGESPPLPRILSDVDEQWLAQLDELARAPYTRRCHLRLVVDNTTTNTQGAKP